MKSMKIDTKELLKQRMAKSTKAYEEVKIQAIASGVYDKPEKKLPVKASAQRIMPAFSPPKKAVTKR
jgi:hypothetical protein